MQRIWGILVQLLEYLRQIFVSQEIRNLEGKVDKMTYDFSSMFATMAAQVKDETDAVASVQTVLAGLKEQVANMAANANLSSDDKARFDSLLAQWDAQNKALAAAVVANTPAAAPTPAAPAAPDAAPAA